MNSNQMDGTFWAIYSLIVLILAVTSIVSIWRIFEKAGDKGWKSLIPLYNTYTLFKVAGYNGWMFLLLIIPIVNLVIFVLLSLKLAERFGKSTLFAVVALILFNPIGFWIIGLGDAKYKKIVD